MRYHLGVDLGTTATTAAVAGEGGPVVMATVGDTETSGPPEDLDPELLQFALDCAGEAGG